MFERLPNALARLALCVAILGASVLAASAPVHSALAVPADGYGFGDGASMVFMDIDDVNRELDVVSTTGASWLRILIDWDRVEPVRGQYDWGYVDGLVNASLAHDLQVLGLITYTASWARPPGTYFTHPPLNAVDYGRFAADVVSRYADKVSHWELWNEPNLPQFFGYLIDNNPARYTELIKTAYPAIKAVQPNSTVVAAGLSPLIGEYSPPAFLQSMYDAGAHGFFDAAAAHPYVFPGGLAADPLNGWSDVTRMHDLMVVNGDGNKKIWLTEFGAPTSDPSAEGVTQIEQARQIADVLAAAAATDFCGPAFIFSIRDVDTNRPQDRDSNLGALLTSDWKLKATAEMLAR